MVILAKCKPWESEGTRESVCEREREREREREGKRVNERQRGGMRQR